MAIVCAWLAVLPACHQDMYDQPRAEPLEPSAFFDDGQSARPLVAGTIARGHLQDDAAFYTGRVDGRLVEELPVELNLALLERGQERFDIFCSPCHARTGNGDGMIVRRGFRRPPSFHIDRLRGAPVGHFFDVLTHGFGAMPSYAAQIPPADRWAIVAYVRALQRSQYARPEELTPGERQELEKLRETSP